MTETLTRVVVGINSGSSLVTKAAVIKVLAIDPISAEVLLDAVGNVRQVSGEVPVSTLRAKIFELYKVLGVSSVATPDLIAPGNTAHIDLATIVAWALSTDVSIQFTGGVDGLNGPLGVNTYEGAKEGTEVSLAITNGNGVVNVLNGVTSVKLTATGGTNPLINGLTSPVTVHLNEGVATVTVSDEEAGTVSIEMSDLTHPTVELAGDTATVALS